MAHLYQELSPITQYFDKKSGFTKDKWFEALRVSRTLYIGNMSFYTTEEQIMELFSKCGEVRKVTMGLNKFKKSPCGFCFVEFFTHEQSAQAVNLLNKTMFDDRLIRVDWDAGFNEGRQFGRGESGDQWRDDFRADNDPARGGEGRNLLRKIEGQPEKQVYVGKRKHDHGKFGKEGDPKRPRQDEGADFMAFGGMPQPGMGAATGFGEGLPMSFGGGFAGYGAPTKGKDKGKGKGKSKYRGPFDRDDHRRDRDATKRSRSRGRGRGSPKRSRSRGRDRR